MCKHHHRYTPCVFFNRLGDLSCEYGSVLRYALSTTRYSLCWATELCLGYASLYLVIDNVSLVGRLFVRCLVATSLECLWIVFGVPSVILTHWTRVRWFGAYTKEFDV